MIRAYKIITRFNTDPSYLFREDDLVIFLQKLPSRQTFSLLCLLDKDNRLYDTGWFDEHNNNWEKFKESDLTIINEIKETTKNSLYWQYEQVVLFNLLDEAIIQPLEIKQLLTHSYKQIREFAQELLQKESFY